MSEVHASIARMRGRANKPKQSAFVFRSWGGRRRGAGRKPTHEKAGTPHLTRPTLTGRHPLHLTLRPRQGVWNLRSKRCFQVIGQALLGLQGRGDLRVVHYSVQGNHMHLIAEAADKAALCAGAKSLAVRLAMKLN